VDSVSGDGASPGEELPAILVLAESLPYPTLKGGDHRTWQNVNVLASCARVGVFGLCSNDRRRDVIPDLPLAFWTTATDPALAWPPPKGIRLAARAWLVDPDGHPSDLYFSEAAAAEISTLLDRFRPDIVVLEGLWLQRYFDVVVGAGRRIVFDAHNVEAALQRELAATEVRQNLEGRVIRDVLPARTEAIERRAIRRADQVWVCSGEDERRIREMYDPRGHLVVVPNGLNGDDALSGAARASAASLTLVFPGFFGHKPNVHAACFLIEEVFPRLARVDEECRLVLVGGLPTDRMLAAAESDARIIVTGAVRDIRPYLAAATAMAVPLFEGSGTRFKILEAFATGLPVISTGKGAEGLDAVHDTHLLIAESADAFVDAALALRRDGTRAARLAAHARKLLVERYSWRAVSAGIREAVGALGTAA
jgi:glycosyltransferase involved in cell wall biosynthesis